MYLEEEYRKNPQMREDVQKHAAGNTGPTVNTLIPELTVAPPRNDTETGSKADSPVEVAEESQQSESPENETSNDRGNSSKSVKSMAGGGTSENEVESRRPTDKNAFHETAESTLESGSRVEIGKKEPAESDINQNERVIGKKSEVSNDDRSTDTTVLTSGTSPRSSIDTTAPENSKKSFKQVRRTFFSPDALRAKKSTKKQKVKTIVLTEEDFATVKGGKITDDDFWEFEEDAEERESPVGIPISELYFKPRVEIADLDRVTQDEFCPLKPEDEESCGEAVPWLLSSENDSV